jgi:hypothetical protein
MLTICCEKCGAGVSVDPGAVPKKIRCPQCRAKVKVPEGLAALPTPKVPGAAGWPAGAGAPERAVEESEAAVILAKLMPWMVSACLHAAALLMLVLIVGQAKAASDRDKKETPPEPIEPKAAKLAKQPVQEKLVEGAFTKAPILTGGAGGGTVRKPGDKPGRPGKVGWFGDLKDTTVGKGWGPSRKSGPMDVYGGGTGGGGGAGGTADFGMPGGGEGGGGGTGFFGEGEGGDGTGGNVKYVIYCIDHSGSVLPAFDEILEELKGSIGGLIEAQEFHVVFFAKDSWQENPPRRLVQANDANKREALAFLRDIRAAGWGSSPIPAIIAGFKAFRAAPNKEGEGKLMYLLTDGDFDTSGYKYKGLMGNEAVVVWLRDNNADKTVHVTPIILGEKPSQETEESMRKIATENGGEYRFVERKY